MGIRIVDTDDPWEEFRRAAVRGLSPGRRAALPPDDPRYQPLPEPEEN